MMQTRTSHVLPQLLAGWAALAASLATAPAVAETRTLTYSIHHPVYGTIGTYTNVIDQTGDSAMIKTNAHIRVSVLGVVLYRQDISRVEHWQDGRLMAFHGLTTVNSREMEIDGMADGDDFIVMSPAGTVVAPADVKMANPWSTRVLQGDALLTPDRGRLEHVRVDGGDEDPVSIEGKTVETKHYEIDRDNGHKHYEVWFDTAGVAVQFRIYNRNGVITFTLAS
jgi:Domain of unknown function (DUF6134)